MSDHTQEGVYIYYGEHTEPHTYTWRKDLFKYHKGGKYLSLHYPVNHC
jgi:hypothetical protein